MSTTTITKDEALANAERLLNHAESETNLHLMRELVNVADSWIAIAREATL